jgi:hypothetical protein
MTTRAKRIASLMAGDPTAERYNSTVKDPASRDISRGWCRLMGLTSMTLMLTCLFVVRNQRVMASFEGRQAEDPTTSGTRARINDALAET